MAIKIYKDSSFNELLKKNLRMIYENKKRTEKNIHVSDILPSNCIRKQYYLRINSEVDKISYESVQNYLRGEASEFAITKLANLGVAQSELELDELIAHPDIMNEEIVIELKDTNSFKRYDLNDEQFLSYLRQLLYYLTISGKEKGIISIKYNNNELKLIKREKEGDYFFRPKNSRKPEIESWNIFLAKDDLIRELLTNEMIRRKKILKKALKEKNVTILPRVEESKRKRICSWCEYYNQCMEIDDETNDAREMAKEIDLLEIRGILNFDPNDIKH
ncbi:MAG: hypothetical protein ACPKQO_02850 [Nitrososphaeraceae archaeon]